MRVWELGKLHVAIWRVKLEAAWWLGRRYEGNIMKKKAKEVRGGSKGFRKKNEILVRGRTDNKERFCWEGMEELGKKGNCRMKLVSVGVGKEK